MNGVQVKIHKKKKEILSNAVSLLHELGVQKLNVRTLAKKSGCSLGTIYNAFESFDDVLLHLKVQAFNELYVMLDRALQKALIKHGRSLEDTIEQLGWAYMQFAKENRPYWDVLLNNRLEKSPQWYHDHVKGKLKAIEESLMTAYAIEEKKAHRVVTYFWAVVHGICSITLNHSLQVVEDEVDEQYIQSYIGRCFKGLLV